MEPVNHNNQTLEDFIKSYREKDLQRYEKPSVTVDTLIFTVRDQKSSNYRKLSKKELYVLMIKRKDHPSIGLWALPGGFIQMEENLDDAALRELKEETNLDDLYMEQLFTFGDKDRDPRTRIISVSYLALIPQTHQGDLKAGDDAQKACWFKLKFNLDKQETHINEEGMKEILQHYKLDMTSEQYPEEALSATICIKNKMQHQNLAREVCILESNGIAFDHAKIITYGLERVRNKIEYTDIIFSLMPKVFTLTELQQVHELLLGEKQYAAQFRRKVEPKLLKLVDQVTEGKGHRPAMRYVYNPMWKLEQSKGVYGL